MIRADFDRIFGRLLDEYTEIHYPPGRQDTIWRAVKDFDASVFADAVDDIIGNHSRKSAAPGKALILGYLRKTVSRAATATAASKGGVAEPQRYSNWCRMCANTGLIHATSTKHPQAAAFVFLCQCEAGTDRTEQFPVWYKERYNHRYEVELHPEPDTWRNPSEFKLPENWKQMISGIPG